MKKKPNRSPPTSAELRRRAEKSLQEQAPKAGGPGLNSDAERLVHELQVHQVELEMQNVELQRTRTEIEAALDSITDLYDFAPVGYLTLDANGMIHKANLAGASLLGVERSALVNQRLERFVAPTDRAEFSRFLKQVFVGNNQEHCEIALQGNDRPPCAAELKATVSASGGLCRVVLTDITERKQNEENRLILSKLEATGILAGGIAHDFNNLLAVIVMGLDLAQTFSPSHEQTRCLEEIKTTAFQARSLTQRLLAFSKGNAPVIKATPLCELIQESAKLALSGSQVRCNFSAAADLWPAMVDEGQISQVIHNLVLNAKEAMPEGGAVSIHAENVTQETQVLPALPPGGYVRVSVIDHGRGISPKDMPRIFAPYFSTKQQGDQKGMGLGLTICHTIIQKHGGAITVKSEQGKGVSVHFLLPAAELSPPGPCLEKHEPLSNTKLPPCRLLVMDDEEALRKAYGHALRILGHEAELVENGEAAIKAFQTAIREGRPFDAVFLDLTIREGMSGLETIQILRQIEPGVQAIVMSGYADDPVMARYRRYGFSGVLEKPFDIQKLEEVLGFVLDTRLSRGTNL